jgi:2-methylisocitrate lyase-like PEP mutase family enzyme
LTARLVEQAGFEAVYLTGGGYSRANGYPDLGLLTLSENVRFIGLTVDAVGIPVIADADSGYGNAINVIPTVREYERSGVAAFHIEDQVNPKKCGHYEGKEVISTAEMVGKIHAAVDTRQDPDLVIIARSDARAVEGLQAAIDRVNAYLEAGADVGFVEAPQNVEELRIVGRSLRGRHSSMSSKAARPRCCRRASSKRWVFGSASTRRRPTARRSGPRNGCLPH